MITENHKHPVLLAGVLGALCCGCLVPPQTKAAVAVDFLPKPQPGGTLGGHPFEPPSPLEPTAPVEYPERLRSRQIEDYVRLWVAIDPSGKVVAVNAARQSLHSEFNEVARRSALAQQWNPGKFDGKPVFTVIQYSYYFRMSPR